MQGQQANDLLLALLAAILGAQARHRLPAISIETSGGTITIRIAVR